ncbi:MAG TPA: LegC family aminotransferase [Saprospiraceae bacterium]|nr:LegC family aminotransferase [Saprospiraceae bacterium]
MILLSAPNISGNEWKYVKDCLDTGWVSSVGAYITEFENKVAEFAGAKYGIATMNGTSALHIAMQLIGVKKGDYVIVPNITFIASINAIKYIGADPILMDVQDGNWQMDIGLLESFLQNDTYSKNGQCYLKKNDRKISAIMPVHVLGNICDMDRLMLLANQYNIPVVEDSTEALGSYFKKKHAGTFGKMGCFSFNGNKIISTGGGGVIVTDDEELAKKAKHITTQAKADPFEYYHDEIGYNYRLVNMLAAMGLAQMEQLPGFIEKKKAINDYYRKEMGDLGDISFQSVNKEVNPNCWLFTFQTSLQKQLLKTLNERKIQSRPFWIPMNQLPMFESDLYITEIDRSNSIYRTCLSIPCSTFLTEKDLSTVVETIKSCFAREQTNK